ncbi:MAG: stage II sporulation protein M [Thermoproteota archaeon]
MIVEKQDAEERRGRACLLLLHTKWGLFPIAILVFSLTFILSSVMPVERDLAEEITTSIKEQLNLSVLDVFMNNLALSLIMMMPVFGFIFSVFSSSLNGMTVSAISTVTGSNPLHIAISLLSSPEGMFEVLAFGLASAQSLAGFFAIVEKRLRKELREYLTTIGIVVGLLAMAVLFEAFQATPS